MSSFKLNRCEHCQDVYNYQQSGEGCFEKQNDSEYCPVCKLVIIEALEKVPKKYEAVWIKSNIPLEDVLKFEKEQMDKDKTNGILRGKRVFMPLFDLTDCHNDNVNGEVIMGEKIIRYSYWTKKGDSEVYVLMQKNIATEELTPWRYY